MVLSCYTSFCGYPQTFIQERKNPASNGVMESKFLNVDVVKFFSIFFFPHKSLEVPVSINLKMFSSLKKNSYRVGLLRWIYQFSTKGRLLFLGLEGTPKASKESY